MTVDPFVFTLLLEMLAITTVAAIGMFVLNHLRKKRDRRAASALVDRLKEGQEQRLGENRKILTSSFGLEEKQAAKLATGIDCAERRFYQTLIATYLRRDYATLENIDTEFMGTVETYRTLTPSREGGDDSGEIERLREEKKRLATDLKSAMEAMGGVLNDYSSALPGSVAGTKSDVQGASDYSSAADDGIVVEEVTAPPQDEVPVTEEAPTEDEAEEPEDSPAEPETVEEDTDPSVESAAAIAAAEDIDIPDYSELTKPDLEDKLSD